MLVKIGKHICSCVYRRSYLLWPPVIDHVYCTGPTRRHELDRNRSYRRTCELVLTAQSKSFTLLARGQKSVSLRPMVMGSFYRAHSEGLLWEVGLNLGGEGGGGTHLLLVFVI